MTEQDKDHKVAEEQTRRMPWWASIICAIVTYCTLKYIVPEIQTGNETLGNLFQMGPVAAPVLTIPFLLLAAKQLYDTDIPETEYVDHDPEDT